MSCKLHDPPTPFKQGATFSFLVQIVSEYPTGYFDNWTATAQIRRENNKLPQGLLSTLSITRETDSEFPDTYQVYHEDTQDWPIGIAELDVIFEDSQGIRVVTTPAKFEILRTVTRT